MTNAAPTGGSGPRAGRASGWTAGFALAPLLFATGLAATGLAAAPDGFSNRQGAEPGQVRDVAIAGGAALDSPSQPVFLTQSKGGAGAGSAAVAPIMAEVRVLYRLKSGPSPADPDALVRAAGGRATVAWFAAHTQATALGANRGELAAALRGALQRALNADGGGVQVLDLEVGALSRPASTEAAAARAPVREAASAAETGAEAPGAALARVAEAQATAAEIVGAARARLARFQADQQAAKLGGDGFLFERYMAALSHSLARVPKTIIDHRLNWPEAPVLDLRPLAPPALPGDAMGTVR